MTGMKDGAAADPFQDPPDKPADDEKDQGDSVTGGQQAGESTSGVSASTGETATDAEIPYIFRRKRTLEGRDQKPLYLQPETQDRLDAFVADLNDRYDRGVKKADVQEAAIIAAIEGETIYTVLERWGYGR